MTKAEIKHEIEMLRNYYNHLRVVIGNGWSLGVQEEMARVRREIYKAEDALKTTTD